MVDINKLYEMDYDGLKKFLLYSCDDNTRNEILLDRGIKEKLIKPDNRHLFTWLANDDVDGKIVPKILDSEGIEILKSAKYSNDQLGALLQCGNKYLNTLFSNELFLSFILENIENVYYDLYALEEEPTIKFAKYAIKKDPTNMLKVLAYINDKGCSEVLKDIPLTRKQTENLILSLGKKALEQVLNTTIYVDILDSYNYQNLVRIFEKDVSIPTELINRKSFVNKISTMFDPKIYRFLINKAEQSSDVTSIENARRLFYDEQINGFDKENEMLPIFKTIYDKSLQLKSENFNIYELYNFIKSLNFFGSENQAFSYSSKINDLINNREQLKKYLKEQSKALLTDMIIDYHFKEDYDTVLKDMQQIVNFKSSGGNAIDEEKAKIYSDILSLDDMNYDKCFELHNRLKSSNWVETFYDDYLNSKREVANMINDVILTEEKLSEYRISYSDKVGVNIYYLNGDPFYALVKSYKNLDKHSILTKDSIIKTPTSSISLDSSYKLDTFGDPRKYYNVIYSKIIPDQLIHSYPVDSFTLPANLEDGFVSSSRINQLMTPEELVKSSPNYNELFMTQKSDRGNKTQYYELEQLPILGIYCYDNVTQEDIESAKNLGVSIVCVNTKAYTPYRDDNQIKAEDRIIMQGQNKKDNEYLRNAPDNQEIDRQK